MTLRRVHARSARVDTRGDEVVRSVDTDACLGLRGRAWVLGILTFAAQPDQPEPSEPKRDSRNGKADSDSSGSCPNEPGSVCTNRKTQTDESKPKRYQRSSAEKSYGQAHAENTESARQHDKTLCYLYTHRASRDSTERPGANKHCQDSAQAEERHAAPRDELSHVLFRLSTSIRSPTQNASSHTAADCPANAVVSYEEAAGN